MLILAGIILLVGLAVACTNGPPEIAATTVPIEPSRAVTQLVNTRQPALTPTPLLATLSPTGIPTLPFCGEESGAAYTFDVVDPFSGEVIQTNNTSEVVINADTGVLEIPLPLDATNFRISFTGVDDDITGAQLSLADSITDLKVTKLTTPAGCGEGYFVYQTDEVPVQIVFGNKVSISFESNDSLGHYPQDYLIKLSKFDFEEARSFFLPLEENVVPYGTHGAILLIGANPTYADKFKDEPIRAIEQFLENQGQTLSRFSFNVYSEERGRVERKIHLEFTDGNQTFLELGDFAYKQGERLQIGVQNYEPQGDYASIMIRYPALSWLGGDIDHPDDVYDGFSNTHRAWDFAYSEGTPLYTLSETTNLRQDTNIRGIEGCEATRGYLSDLAAAFQFGHTAGLGLASGESIEENDYIEPGIQIATVDETQPFPCAGVEHVHFNLWTDRSMRDVQAVGWPLNEDHVIDPFDVNPFGEEGVSLPYGLWLEETLPDVIKERFHNGFYERNKSATYDSLITQP
jgi:hypothetical protein